MSFHADNQAGKSFISFITAKVYRVLALGAESTYPCWLLLIFLVQLSMVVLLLFFFIIFILFLNIFYNFYFMKFKNLADIYFVLEWKLILWIFEIRCSCRNPANVLIFSCALDSWRHPSVHKKCPCSLSQYANWLGIYTLLWYFVSPKFPQLFNVYLLFYLIFLYDEYNANGYPPPSILYKRRNYLLKWSPKWAD